MAKNCRGSFALVITLLVKLNTVGAVRLKGSSQQSREAQSKCCCQAARNETCRELDVTELTPSNNREGHFLCPTSQGWHTPSSFGMDYMPDACLDHEDDDVSEITVKAYWVRHGWSCSNAIQAQGKKPVYDKFGWVNSQIAYLESLKFATYSDPSLTDAAIERAQILGRHIRTKILQETGDEKPLVFSSALVRAVETALWNFPGWGVRPIPFIAEKGSMPDNTPQSWEDQEANKLDRDPTTKAMLKDIVFDVNAANHTDRASYRKNNYGVFKKYFPGILEELLEKKDYGDEVPVVLVSHSAYMRDNLECTSPGDGKPRNNEVWVQKYKVKLGAQNAELEHAGCEKLYDSSYFPKPQSRICQRDVARCGMKPTYWLDLDERECTDLGNASIVDRDVIDNERYISESDWA